MKEKLLWGVAVVLLASGAVGAWSYLRNTNNANFPNGLLFVCSDDKCGHQFTMTTHEFGQFQEKHYGEDVPCPKCGKKAVKALKCPHCGAVSPMTRDLTECPKCHQAMDLDT
jgi:hypothetical protein